jgi:hypothetical protein
MDMKLGHWNLPLITVSVFLTFTEVKCLRIKWRKCTTKTDSSFNTIKFCLYSQITIPAKPYIWYCCQCLHKHWTIKEYYKDFYLLDYNTSLIQWLYGITFHKTEVYSYCHENLRSNYGVFYLQSDYFDCFLV